MKNALVAIAGLLSWLCLVDLLAFSPIPRESAKALGATKSKKPIDDGLVFVNGKFLPPPYVVERWGTGLRINGVQVTGQVIDWEDFLKTQGASSMKPVAPSAPSAPPPPAANQAPAPAAVEVAAAAAAEPVEFEEVSCSLDYLFDDGEPAPHQGKSAKPKGSRKSPPKKRPAAPKPSAPPTPALDGPFVMNDASKAMLARVNAARTEIDRALRGGWFFFFGDGYSRVSGDRNSAESMLARLPELQKGAESAKALKDSVRAAGLSYLHDAVCEDLFRNRVCYRALKDRRARLEDDREWKRLLGPGGKGGR